MNVYVISTGERGEGSTPVAVTRSLQAARNYVMHEWLRDLLPGEGQRLDNAVDLVHVHRLRLSDAK